MRIPASPRTVVVVVALSATVGVGAAIASSAATEAPGYSSVDTLTPSSQSIAVPPSTPGRRTAGATTARRDATVGPAEASRIAALVGHGRVTDVDEESTPTGLTYEMTVVQPDGTERTVTVNRATGRVLANTLEDAADPHETANHRDDAGRADRDRDGDQQRKDAHDDATED
jgi:uncharacterized membrane protein YkoI